MSLLNRLPKVLDYYGYSCQIWIRTATIKQVTGKLPWVWFSLEFSPCRDDWRSIQETVDSSNPAKLYLSYSRAAKTNDVGHKDLKLVRLNVLKFAQDEDKDPTHGPLWDREITGASMEQFRPEVWKLDLRKIAKRKHGLGDNASVQKVKYECRKKAENEVKKNPGQVLQPDEYWIDDLQNGEFERIIER